MGCKWEEGISNLAGTSQAERLEDGLVLGMYTKCKVLLGGSRLRCRRITKKRGFHSIYVTFIDGGMWVIGLCQSLKLE
jgi:hypothetical protein